MQTPGPSNKILAFKSRPKPAQVSGKESLRVLYTQNREAGFQPKKYTRHIPQAPERILDAPELLDDYYLNLLDWGRNNVLSVALGGSIYLWNASDGSIQELMQAPGETHVTSVSWMQEGNYLAVGTSDHKVQLWDADKLKQVRSMDGHRARVSSLAWNNHLLSSGGRDSQVVHHDVRVAEHKVGVLRGHTQEVCGLRWSPWGTQLASGGNDNLLNIWDERRLPSAPPRPFFPAGARGLLLNAERRSEEPAEGRAERDSWPRAGARGHLSRAERCSLALRPAAVAPARDAIRAAAETQPSRLEASNVAASSAGAAALRENGRRRGARSAGAKMRAKLNVIVVCAPKRRPLHAR
mgnify:CR=1 FL=1